jgi:HAMP domain-containing protein
MFISCLPCVGEDPAPRIRASLAVLFLAMCALLWTLRQTRERVRLQHQLDDIDTRRKALQDQAPAGSGDSSSYLHLPVNRADGDVQNQVPHRPEAVGAVIV